MESLLEYVLDGTLLEGALMLFEIGLELLFGLAGATTNYSCIRAISLQNRNAGGSKFSRQI
jgi:hypothetical protein